MKVSVQQNTLGDEIVNSIRNRTTINILIDEAKTLFKTIKRYEGFDDVDREMLNTYKITYLSALERKFENSRSIATLFGGDIENEYCKYKYKIEQTLSKLNTK